MGRLPLEGIRVCDFTWVVVGPNTTQMLAVMGAEVIKIESNVHTDINRRNPPYGDGIAGIERSGTYHSRNMSKKSCTLNLTKPRAIEVVKEIIKKSDVVVENFRVGVMEHFGLGYDILSKLKPDLVLVSASGLGKTGPYKNFVCYNEEAYAYGGLGYMTGYERGEPSMICGDYGDYIASNMTTFAILAALAYRSKTGQGQIIDVSMAETVASHIPDAIMDYSMNHRIYERMGNHIQGKAPHNCYRCKGEDKWVAISISNDDEWRVFCRVIGKPKWTQEEKFGDQFHRCHNQEELDALIGTWTRGYTPHEVMHLLQDAGVTAGPSLSIKEFFTDPHVNERGLFIVPDHPEVGKRTMEGMPWKMSASQPKFEPAPLLGQHNDYVFRELLGMSDDEIAELIIDEVIC
ncbi:MAG: CoA transferase [Dehalococcoidales bacterium]|nr:CoA transferase [Dehalococcoidales bacterium]